MDASHARSGAAPRPPAAPDLVARDAREARDARAPSQVRGQKRVDEILDTAEALIAEIGVDATTTNAIAERAGASVGSLYHFFPSKEAIVQALAHRFASLSRGGVHAAMSDEAVRLPLEKLFERIVMGQAEMMDRHPAFGVVYEACAAQGPCNCPPGECTCDAPGLQAYKEMHDAIIGRVNQYLAARMPRMPKKERELRAYLSFSVVHHLLHDARRMPKARRAGVLRELQRMMVRYFEPLDAKYALSPARPSSAGGGRASPARATPRRGPSPRAARGSASRG